MTTHLAQWPWRKTYCGQDLTDGFEGSVDRTDIYGPHLPPPYCGNCEGVQGLRELAHVNLKGRDDIFPFRPIPPTPMKLIRHNEFIPAPMKLLDRGILWHLRDLCARGKV